MKPYIDILFESITKRGFARIGELSARVFWNPMRSDMLALLGRSRHGDLRGSVLWTKDRTLVAIWFARSLGHWSFHNECFAREGIDPVRKLDFRVVRDIELLREERYWKRSRHYRGKGFFYAIEDDALDIANIPELVKLFGPAEPI